MIATLSAPILAVGLVVALGVFRWIIQPAFLSPLAKAPSAHWSASFSSLWIFYERFLQKDTLAVHDAHSRLGPIVRLGPNDISVNFVEGVRTVYGGNFEKNDWYANIFSNFGNQPAFAMSNNAEHARRNRTFGNVYSKSYLLSSPAFDSISRKVVNERLGRYLSDVARTGRSIEFYNVFLALTLDLMTAYLYGLKAGSDLVSRPDLAAIYAKAYKTRVQYVSLPQEVPGLLGWMARNGILPYILPPLAANRGMDWDPEEWLLEMQDKAEEAFQHAKKQGKQGDVDEWPTVYGQVRNNIVAEQQTKLGEKDVSEEQISPNARLHIASEMLDHTFAGFDTGSQVLTYLAWELSKPDQAVWQDKLRSEFSQVADTGDARALDGLRVLHAVVQETLRLHSPVAGNQVRVSPPKPVVFNAAGQPAVTIPPNTRIHAQAWSLHRNPSVFPEPDRWSPERWLESSPEQLKEMNRWFWAFGSGARMCAGTNLAMIELKMVTASIWRRFRTEIVNGAGMTHNGGYLSGPLGSDGTYLTLRLKDVEVNT